MVNHVLSYLDEIVERVPDKAAYANEKESFTFRQVYEQSRAIGTGISRKGCYQIGRAHV